MRKILDENFFAGDALTIAETLIGKYIVRSDGDSETALMLNEVEAYDGPEDRACHASKGMTPRTEIMFAEGGFFYVYFVYGMHWMLNIVVGKKGYPAAVLIRGAGKVSGPARLTKFLGVDSDFNKKKAVKESGLWFEDRGMTIDKNDIIKTPRIGVDYAGEVWSQMPYRFVLKS